MQAPADPIIEPGRRIIDPHHHLWRGETPYLVEQLWEDTSDGHAIEATVFIECLAEYRSDGPEHLRCVGETEFVVELATQSANGPGPRVAAIVGAANLQLGARVEEVFEAHIEAGRGLFRGIRHAAAYDPSSDIRVSHHKPPPHLYLDAAFREGFSRLAPLGLSFDAWLYHPQIPELTQLAREFPETAIVLDHFGGPIGVGPYADKADEVFNAWLPAMRELARCPNVSIKLGGMAMPINGYGWHKTGRPTAEVFRARQERYYLAAIDAFGPSRSMFESNFPVDRQSIDYRTLWNAMKAIAAPYSEGEREEMFYGTAQRFYRIAEANADANTPARR